MKDIKEIIKKGLEKAGVDTEGTLLSHPKDLKNGDFSFFVKDKAIDISALSFADLEKNKYIKSVAVVGQFINIYLSDTFFSELVEDILKSGADFGKNSTRDGERILFEYTNPNPFKEFHIGHLMSNTIGESFARITEWSGATVKRANYQGDVGLQVAKAIWGMMELSSEMPHTQEDLTKKSAFLGRAYVHGSSSYTDDESAKKEIDALNKTIYEKSDPKVVELYNWGRKVSLDHFEDIYAKLGTKFDYYFFESETAPRGLFIVEEFLAKNVFEKSDGAVVFKGEQYGLHTRVFVNSQGLPTYETKELGLSKMKFEKADFDLSVVVTANEQNEYYKVVLKALEFVDAEIANKTRHIGHGMLRFTSGKMSSRTGNIITGESLMVDVEKLVYEKIKDRELSDTEKKNIMSQVAVGAIKYSILRQSSGKDIIFDFEKSLSFEGDSGPYLQYAHARACSILRKAKEAGVSADFKNVDTAGELEKMLAKFADITERAEKEFAPQLIVTYLTELAGSFNSYYANTPIIAEAGDSSPYRVALTQAFKTVMQNGLWLLGIEAPEKM
ncbi:arginine--tRNA ligase [Candidatus Parcubacteria bacterium]|nr:arginine--tRNA ligase [Candidatus Parcubacteria bacterium]